MNRKLADLLTATDEPLFIVGTDKSVGKTTALNRLRYEARNESNNAGFGILTAGWDGEERDHLTGGDKPNVHVFPSDIVVTSGTLLAKSSASFEILWASSEAHRAGREVIARCVREGDVEIVGPPSVNHLRHLIEMTKAMGASRVLIDGALDRTTPVSASEAAEVGLVAAVKPSETVAAFVTRMKRFVASWCLKQSDIERPVSLAHDAIAILKEDRWRFSFLEALHKEDIDDATPCAFVGGPLTLQGFEALTSLGVKRIIIQDASRLFLPFERIVRAKKRGVEVEVFKRMRIAFLAVRLQAMGRASLPPVEALQALKNAMPDLPIFDAWASH